MDWNFHGRRAHPAPFPDRLTIVPVRDRRQREAFIRLPWRLYADDPMWVAPLLQERRHHLSPKNPFFDHADCRCWLAYRGNTPVGRVSAQIDRLHLDRHKDRTGFFGMIEAENRLETFTGLLAAAEGWLGERGMERVRGPLNLSMNQECGLLIRGFDTPPSMMMGHGRAYYGHRMFQCGYRKAKDLLAYFLQGEITRSPAMERVARKTRARVQVRKVDLGRIDRELAVVRRIFNEAWSKNWGFIPFTEREFTHLAKDLKPLILDDLVWIASVDGRPAAFILVLPNLNEAIRDLNGRLLPLGWIKLLWRLKVRLPRSARTLLMGVLPRYQDSPMGAALSFRMISDLRAATLARGMDTMEMSWVLEDNSGVRSIIESVGGQAYKTYRIYEKGL